MKNNFRNSSTFKENKFISSTYILENKSYIVLHYKIVEYSHALRGFATGIYKKRDKGERIMYIWKVLCIILYNEIK